MYSPILISIFSLFKIIISPLSSSTSITTTTSTSHLFPILLAIYDIFMSYIATLFFWYLIFNIPINTTESNFIEINILYLSIYLLLTYYLIISSKSIPFYLSKLLSSFNHQYFSLPPFKLISIYIFFIHTFITFYIVIKLSISHFSLSFILSIYCVPISIYTSHLIITLSQQSNNQNNLEIITKLPDNFQYYSYFNLFFSYFIPLSFIIFSSFIVSSSSLQSEILLMISHIYLVYNFFFFSFFFIIIMKIIIFLIHIE